MPKIDYPRVIKEDQEELEKLQKRHRYSHLFHRVKMLRLLKSGECSNLGQAAEALGYSWRQCQRWFAAYKEGGLSELLVSRVHERAPKELVTEEAFEELEGAMKEGQIATIVQAHRFLLEKGIDYAHPESVGGLLRRRKVKLKTGRPRHEKANPKKREVFKNLADEIRRELGEDKLEKKKPLKILAFDEACFDLINCHKRRYCPKGFRSP